jgi:hypothetical protein
VPGGIPDPSLGGPQGEDPAAPRCRGAFPTRAHTGIIPIPARRWALGVRPVRGLAQTDLPGQAVCINGRRRVHRGGPLSSRSGRGVPDQFSAFPGAKLEASARILKILQTRSDLLGELCRFSRVKTGRKGVPRTTLATPSGRFGRGLRSGLLPAGVAMLGSYPFESDRRRVSVMRPDRVLAGDVPKEPTP